MGFAKKQFLVIPVIIILALLIGILIHIYFKAKTESKIKLISSQDYDSDGLINKEEQKYGTNPLLPDTDFDGFNDLEEIKSNHNPLVNEKIAALKGNRVYYIFQAALYGKKIHPDISEEAPIMLTPCVPAEPKLSQGQDFRFVAYAGYAAECGDKTAQNLSKTELAVWDTQAKNIIYSLKDKGIVVLSSPKFTKDDKKVVFLKAGSINILDLDSKTLKTINIPPEINSIQYIKVYNDKVYFPGMTRIKEGLSWAIFAVDINDPSQKIQKVISFRKQMLVTDFDLDKTRKNMVVLQTSYNYDFFNITEVNINTKTVKTIVNSFNADKAGLFENFSQEAFENANIFWDSSDNTFSVKIGRQIITFERSGGKAKIVAKAANNLNYLAESKDKVIIFQDGDHVLLYDSKSNYPFPAQKLSAVSGPGAPKQ